MQIRNEKNTTGRTDQLLKKHPKQIIYQEI